MTNAALTETLRATDAVQFGESEPSHGSMPSYYADRYLFEAGPRCLKLIAEAFAERIADDDRPVGVTPGVVPSMAATAVGASKSYIIAHEKAREYRTARRIKGALDKGEEVVVLEDITAIGQSTADAVKALCKTGAVIGRIVVIADRQEGTAGLLVGHNTALGSLLTVEDLLANADG